jgi:hypothetical protein
MNNLRTPRTIITGTGRAGTSVLMEIFTRFGFDTGFDPKNVKKAYLKGARAGLEVLPSPSGPAFVKAIELSGKIGQMVEEGYVIERVIVPIRDLAQAVKSRAAIGDEKSGKPGALLAPKIEQANEFAHKNYRLCLDCARHMIPLHFIEFPLFARDFDYFYGRMLDIFGRDNVQWWEECWWLSVDQEKINRY